MSRVDTYSLCLTIDSESDQNPSCCMPSLADASSDDDTVPALRGDGLAGSSPRITKMSLCLNIIERNFNKVNRVRGIKLSGAPHSDELFPVNVNNSLDLSALKSSTSGAFIAASTRRIRMAKL